MYFAARGVRSFRMRFITVSALAAAVLLCAGAAFAQGQPQSLRSSGLMPLPSSLTAQEGNFALTADFTVSTAEMASPRLERGLKRFLTRMEDRTGLHLDKEVTHGAGATTMLVTVHTPDAPVQTVDTDESYTLRVTANGVRIEAVTTPGALHALETLLQLVQPAGSTGFQVPAVTIQDTPRFRWRGLMIDCSRHFEPLDVLKRNIDAMAAVKLNVFHWHLTDDQGFRIESKRFPRLTSAGSDGLFYTQDQARELVRYAYDRGIRVVPEFEMPGHSSAWLVAYPELNSGSTPPGIRRQFGVSDYVLDPTREETYRSIEAFLGEMVTIFPDAYVHIGGDEAPAPDWKANPRILAFKQAHHLADNDALQAYFNTKVLAILTRLHRRMLGWDEIFNPGLPKDVVIQSWRGEASLARAAEAGYQGVLSAPFYLDGMRPAGTHYLADPIPADTKLTPQQQRMILGGEVCMWAEHINQRTIDSRVWPRTAAIAERFWSPQGTRDVADMYRRLRTVSLELESLGLQHLTREDAGLRELAGTESDRDLHTFAAALEPVSFGERASTQHTTQLTPLTGFVDAVVPDPPIRYQLEEATHTLLRDPKSTSAQVQNARQLLQNFFAEEKASVQPVKALMATAPRLQPIEGRADQLGNLATIGEDALRYLQSGAAAPAGWKTESLATIEAAKKPAGLVRFHFLDTLTLLVNAAS